MGDENMKVIKIDGTATSLTYSFAKGRFKGIRYENSKGVGIFISAEDLKKSGKLYEGRFLREAEMFDVETGEILKKEIIWGDK